MWRSRVKKVEADAVIKDAMARGKILQARVLREAGGLVSVSWAAGMLGVTAQELEAKQPLIFISTDGGGYPRFQFESEMMLDGVVRTLSAIGVEEPWGQLHFFFLHLNELGGRRPVDAIRDGALDAVVLAASHFGRHGAS
jgi:hypothetical protein